ncbi:hypothetical protein, conserved [Trypanosoma brucei gambiense DAL972]|uniref:Uncharacterized protein n=1 Tax=Trypanosoma brucei gambiense (strain MHOM/CI/86/DAL972) TaxID=679716 RepID=C9ZIL9_TRYB9|nr:hypothetical protein, conserved [Trypanosoma brucei gambiense DAL972]CBH09011.1 hypothetical protein, conserved [Trypanosoma brucei gambiense DAL972]|eukprot:XP_011771452.1 hypothetical protein, conserved [Trypanosoma brucei gambiense DAL972]
MRTFLAPTFPRWCGLFAKSPVLLMSISETGLQSAFRRACAEEGVDFREGLPEDVLAAVIAAPGQVTVEEARAQLNSSTSFRVDAGLVHLTADGAREQSQMETMLLKLATKIPPTGVSGAQFRAILEDEAPHFQPSAVGALSLKEAVQRYPRLFDVETDTTGKWFVRPAGVGKDGRASVGKNSAPISIINFCSERALMGNQADYVPLHVAMREESVASEGVLRDLVDSEELSKQLQIRFSVRLRPKRPVTNAFCFVDGDEIGLEAVDAIWKEMNLSDKSTRLVARQPTSRKHNSSDIVAPADMPTYAVVERKARELSLTQSVVLQDVVYMCSLRQFSLYADHIAKLNAFPDADVYVCCPSKVKLVAQKQFVPL